MVGFILLPQYTASLQQLRDGSGCSPQANAPLIHEIIYRICDTPPGFCSKNEKWLSPFSWKAEKHLIQTSFKYLQGWRLNHFPGQPVPMLDNPLGEEKFPNIQSKPPLAQLEAISSCPITCYLGEETKTHLCTTSFQVVVESDKVSPQPPFLQAKQSQLPQPLLIRLLLQTLHQLRCPSLYTLQYLNIPLVVGGPKLNTVFEVWPHQCRVQGDNHFPSCAGHAIFDTGQDAIGLLGRLDTLLAHIQAAVNKHPQVLLCWAAFQPLFPKPVALHGVAVAQVQDLALGLVEPHTIGPSPSIQPVQVPLQSLPTLQQINTPTQLGVVCKLTESTLDPFVQIIDKDVKQNWPQHRALGNTACDRPPTGVNSIHHHSLGPAVQPVLYPAKSTPVQAMSSQFLQENAIPPGMVTPTTSLGSLFLCLITLSVKKFFLISNLNLSWPISSCPMACYVGEETDPHLSTTSFQVVVESDKVSPQPPFLQARQPQFPQPLLIRLVLQTLHQLRCPSLDTLQHLNVPLVVRGPKLNTVFEVWPHQCQVQGDNHFPSYAGHAISNTSLDAVGFLGHLGTLLAHIQVAVNQHPQVLFCWAAFQPLFPKPVALHGVVVTQVQDLAFHLLAPHTVGLGPSIQPVQVPLQSLPTLKQINTPDQLGVICKLTEGALNPFVQIIDKDIKQNWPQY
ncbi:hypothetical protein QYF61_004220 [Mycteria americana]|uniref:Uncharacterized protein n=1 Tax=Mycteria americana TaxID=33587 RepID=A0AAN7NEH7_MYCAM|nr:hypothetical protein QYF61_004220 [Mycteria americana]